MKSDMQIKSSKSGAEISQIDYLDRIAKAKRELHGYNARSIYEYFYGKLNEKEVSHFYSFWGGKANDISLLNRMEYIAENKKQLPKQI